MEPKWCCTDSCTQYIIDEFKELKLKLGAQKFKELVLLTTERLEHRYQYLNDIVNMSSGSQRHRQTEWDTSVDQRAD